MTSPGIQPQHDALWTREFFLVCAANIAVFFNVHLFLSTFAFYAIARFAIGDAVGGASASIFVIGAIFARLGAGPLMERVSLGPMLLACFAIFVLLPPFYLATDSLVLTMFLRVVHGLDDMR